LADFCSCGAELPPDALFCHKCGKPQRDIVEPEPIEPVEEVSAPVAVAVAPPAPAPSFGNPVAIRIALAAAAVATLMSFLPYLNWLAAGFFAVFFYRRRTGALLNMESGVRMGWFTGVMMFGMMALLLTISLLFFQAAGGIASVQAEFKNAVDPRVLEALKSLQSGTEIFRLLVQLFVFTTLLSMAGGALGAKMVGRS
jgi:hypothetical protein